LLDGADAGRHAAREFELGSTGVTQQTGLLAAQRQHLVDDGFIIVLPGLRTLSRGSGRMRRVEALAQVPVVGVGDDGPVARVGQIGAPAGFARVGRLGRQHLEVGRRQPGKGLRVVEIFRPAFGGVEHVIAEGVAEP